MKRLQIVLLLINFNCVYSQNSSDSIFIKQVDSLIQVSRALTSKREFDQALAINEIAEKIALEKFGKISIQYANCCFIRGRILEISGDYKGAELWYLESKTIRKEVLGTHHLDYAKSLNNLALLYQDIGQYEKVEALLMETRTIREEVLGRYHVDFASSLNNLANFYLILGKYEEAETLYLETKIIREKNLGRFHIDYAGILNNLSALYINRGQYENAIPYLLEAIEILRSLVGNEHLNFVMTLNNLAISYQNSGQYENAERHYLEAKNLVEKMQSKADPIYFTILLNLAGLDFIIGQLEKAESLLLEAKTLGEKTLGVQHPNYVKCIGNLGNLYNSLGEYEKAEKYLNEACSVWEKVLGKNCTNYANCKSAMGTLYINLGEVEKAEKLYIEACLIFKEAFLKNHPDYANALDNLAVLYRKIGSYDKAKILFLEAKSIREKTIGTLNLDYGNGIARLAYLANLMKDNNSVRFYYNYLSEIIRKLSVNGIFHLSEKELSEYINLFTNELDRIYSISQATQNRFLFSTSFDNCLFLKGFLSQSKIKINQLALIDSSISEKINKLKYYKRKIVENYTRPFEKQDSSFVIRFENTANQIEKDLTRTVKEYDKTIQYVNWQEVQSALKPGEAAIEFVHYRYYNPSISDSIMYAAMILRANDSTPSFIPLFEERSFDSILNRSGASEADYINQLYSLKDQSTKNERNCLNDLIWKPLENELAAIKTIYFSPSGLLLRINMGAIPINAQENIADRYKMIELNSTKQLVILDDAKLKISDAVLYGGIQYEMDTSAIASNNLAYHNKDISFRGEISFIYSDSTARSGTWKNLKWTEREIDEVNKILVKNNFHSITQKGYAATEESFKNIGANKNPSPRILHIATHGYFFEDPKEKVGSSQFAVGSQESVFKMSDHPMLRSGLILAGGNAAWQGKQTLEGREDGILTAYEISQMNLSNTELVVLSACETGLGDIQGNEGVYGLQRAFKIAGAKYIIMSLWQVPDKQTSLLMTTFYKKWLEDKMTIPDAFHAAQKELREIGLDPYQWAGFVLVE